MEKKMIRLIWNGNWMGIVILTIFVLFEIVFFVFIFSFFPHYVLASVGEDNVTVSSILAIGSAPPQILNITINNGNSIDLSPNATTTVSVEVIITDSNGEGDIDSVDSEFFDNIVSSYGGSDDNNFHYTNNSCSIDVTYGDLNEVNATCRFGVAYYANNATWNFTVLVNDSGNFQASDSKTATINTLLALGLPNSLNYGEINATFVSNEQIVNVTNFGNVFMNLSLSGYAVNVGDNLSMNCTLGDTKNISINLERYNLTSSNLGSLSLSKFSTNYTNLSSNVILRKFDLSYRQNDTSAFVDDTNSTYWRIYVPAGVAGNCTGNIVFGSVQGGGN